MRSFNIAVLTVLAYLCGRATVVCAHIAAFTRGMYCLNGTTGNNFNSEDPVLPLYQLEFDQWWFHAVNGCNERPPDPGDVLTLPSGDSVVLELAGNQGFTSFSYNGKFATDWPNGQTYPDDLADPSCIISPNLHAQNESMAAGTALSISYQSDITEVTPENLVVISVAYGTPFKRFATYDIPAGLPACPEGGCICGWGWIPNGCGERNMYHEAIRCNVTGNIGTKPLATPRAPVWCEEDQSACIKGPKQMIYWNQASGNNIVVPAEYDASGVELKSPRYSAVCGFEDGAQSDIFDDYSSSAATLVE
ncbi:hypothetical protein BDP27DRAFT_1454267, partial [Rhodocollybia butyracea]